MKNLIQLIAVALASAGIVQAQTTVLYQQDFGTTNGGTTLAAVGWGQALPASGYSGIYAQSPAVDGNTGLPLPQATLYFGGTSGTGIFFTTNGAGSGTGGDSAFTSIDPTPYTNLSLSVESQYSYQGANLTCWFAVEVGGSWYVDTNAPLTTAQHSAGSIFYSTTLTYNPAATNWNVLANVSAPSIGPVASANLSGAIDGIGIMVSLANAGSWNFNDFQILSISNPPVQAPVMTAPPLSQTVYAGGGFSFAVGTSISAPLSYAWIKDGVALTNDSRISGANSAELSIENAGVADAGTYWVVVSNSAGYFDTSTNAIPSTLTVNALPQDYLYAETFPFVGPKLVNYPVSTVGWVGNLPNSPNRLFQTSGGAGAIFAYEGGPATEAFTVTTNSDAGLSGLAFPAINPADYPAVSFSVQVAPTYQPANVSAYFAVQMNGSSWYAMNSPIPVNTSAASATYTTYSQQFSSLSGNWNQLSLSSSGATIGAAATGNLTGVITGSGLVVNYGGGGGNFNFANFLIVTDAAAATPPVITVSPLSQTVYAGAGVSFAGMASGSQPLVYSWQFNGNPLTNGPGILGANSNVLTLLNVGTNQTGSYSLIASNSAGTDNSANYFATALTVNSQPTNLLYDESFPFVGPQTGNASPSTVGWVAAVPDSPNRLFQVASGFGAVYSYEGSPGTTAFYATTLTDTGLSGLPFPSIPLASVSNLLFSASIAPTTDPTNLTASVAVQIDGGAWYVSSTNLPVDTSAASATYTVVSQAFSPYATNWNQLTLTSTGASEGSQATAALTGTLTGAGLVFHFSNAGSFNLNDFQITGNETAPPETITALVVGRGSLTLSWPAQAGLNLQSATNLAPPVVWTDVPGTLGQGNATIPTTGRQMYFRLAAP